MTKDVMISIRGIQFENGQDGEKIESIQMGEYYNKNKEENLHKCTNLCPGKVFRGKTS